MGTVTITVEIGDPQGRDFRPVVMEVDTGSTHTAIPRQLLQDLGVRVDRRRPSRLADGSIQPVDEGETRIRIAGMEFTTMVIFAEENEPSLLGVITLEEAHLGVDPLNGELIPVLPKR